MVAQKKVKAMNKRKRMTQSGPKKWTDCEVVDILNYMQVHRNLERPTAQIYYRKLIAKTNIDATWSLVRHKVRHLKNGWQKAEAYVKSTRARVEADDDVIRAKMLRMCPHYEQLEEIYNTDMEVALVESGAHQGGPQWSTNMAHSEEESLMDAVLVDDSSDFIDSDTSSVYKTKRKAPISSLAQEASMEAESVQLENEQLVWSKQQRKSVIKEKKQTLKKLRIKSKFKLKQEEVESRERMHKIELEFKHKQEELESRERMHKLELEFQHKQVEVESRERMQKLELELKYKNTN